MLQPDLILEPATEWGYGTLHPQCRGAEVVGTTSLRIQASDRLSQRHDYPPIGRRSQQVRAVPGLGLLDLDDRPGPQRVPTQRSRWFASRQTTRATLAG